VPPEGAASRKPRPAVVELTAQVEKLRNLEQAQEEFEKQSRADRLEIDQEEKSRILALTTDFPQIWNDPNTSDRDRKRMARLLIEDVTLTKKEAITAHVRFKGGTTTTMTLPVPQRSYQTWQTSPEVVKTVDALLDDYTYKQIAAALNERGLRSGKGGRFSPITIGHICGYYGLKSRFDRLRERGMLTIEEIAGQLGVSTDTIKRWRKNDLVRGHEYNDNAWCLYEPPGENGPTRHPGRKPSQRQQHTGLAPDHAKEVQYEA